MDNTNIVNQPANTTGLNQVQPQENVGVNQELKNWPLMGMLAGSLMSLLPSYLIAWRSLIVMEKREEAKAFILLGFIFIPLLYAVEIFIPYSKYLISISPIIYIWLKYLKNIHPLQPKPFLRWQIFKWGFLGIIIENVLMFILFGEIFLI